MAEQQTQGYLSITLFSDAYKLLAFLTETMIYSIA